MLKGYSLDVSMRTIAVGLLSVSLLTACGREPAFVTRCKRSAELQLTAPDTARYGSLRDIAPNPDNPSLQQLDRSGYWGSNKNQIWLAYVDSSNALGGTVRNYVVCVELDGEFSLDVAPGIGALTDFIN